MRQHTLSRVSIITGLIIATATPISGIYLPNWVFAEAEIRQEDRRADRQQDRQADRRQDRQADRRQDRRIDLQRDRPLDRQLERRVDRQVDRRLDRGGRGR